MLTIEYNFTMSCSKLINSIISFVLEICELINLNINSIESYINIISEILTIVLLIWGCIIVKKIKDKKLDATTDFYAKLKVHLIHLKNQLGTEELTVLNYLYDDTVLKQANLSKPDSYETFLNIVNSMLDFLKKSDNQVIPSSTFFDNINVLIEKLSKYTLMPYYKPFSDLNNQEVKKELDCLNTLIEDLINEISKEQMALFKAIWAKK